MRFRKRRRGYVTRGRKRRRRRRGFTIKKYGSARGGIRL